MIPIPKTDLRTIHEGNSGQVLHMFEHESIPPRTKLEALEKLAALGDFETLAAVVENEAGMDSMHPMSFLEFFDSHPEPLADERILSSATSFPALAFLLSGSDAVCGMLPRESLERLASGCSVSDSSAGDERRSEERRSCEASGGLLFRNLVDEEAFFKTALAIRDRYPSRRICVQMWFPDALLRYIERTVEAGEHETALRMLDALRLDAQYTRETGDFAVQGKYSAFLMTWAEYADERLVLNALRPFSVMEKAAAALHLLVSEIGFSEFTTSELERFFLDDRMGAIKALFRSTAFFGKSATKGIDRRRFIDAVLLAASTDGARHFGRREKKMSVLEAERCLGEITRYVVEELPPVAGALNAVAYIFPEGAPGYAGVESVLEKFASLAAAAALATCALDSGEVGPFDDMPVW